MNGQSANMLDVLREQFGRVHAKIDQLTAGQLDLSRRVSSLKAQVALLHGDFAHQSMRIDRIEVRLERIERRLDIVPAC
jgi:phosphoglycerate-specific signal transduction histidine kinase